jgi:hypothetical protein
LQLSVTMTTQNKTQTHSDKPQGDNRQAGDVDGNRGADPKKGSQGVNQSAGTPAGGDNSAEGAGAGPADTREG